ncbi:MAG: PQQ-binding-like beta-propeller repeat protein [Verrucomicrobiae bacterium]|nr:PQQ-binding-like beta-propeller repeat protein [Verrucomicrobiae bacterium]
MKSLMISLRILSLLFCGTASLSADEWPQGSGPSGDFATREGAPTSWSVALDRGVLWKRTLPETGQSTPVISQGKVFFSTLKPVMEDSTLGSDLVVWCCDALTGDVLWNRPMIGQYPQRLSGCFADSSSPPAVCDGEHVVFINASGGVACFDLSGKPLWQRDILSVGRTLPFLHEGRMVFTRQIYPPEPDGNFPHKYKDSPLEMWTQLQALDIRTGKEVWTTRCGVNMGNAIVPQRLKDGRAVAAVGRGGGHGPPEKPDGISLVDLRDGATLWTLPLEGFMSTMSYRLRDDQLHVFHEGEHLSIDALSGRIVKRVSILNQVRVMRHSASTANGYVEATESIPDLRKGRMITQTSNLLVGRFHYFRSYTHPYLGRVDVENGEVEYLELPLQISRAAGREDQLQWYAPPKSKKDIQMKDQALVPNDLKNSRGFTVFGDKRSKGNGWGHVAAPTPSVAGDYLYVPVQNGTVYVLRWDVPVLTHEAVVSINDLGPAGQCYTRASLSFAGGRIYAHTIRELICIAK